MKNDFKSELILGHALNDNLELRVFPDMSSDHKDLMGINIILNGNEVYFDPDKHEEYFHLDKFNVKCLIDFLQNIYDSMENKT